LFLAVARATDNYNLLVDGSVYLAADSYEDEADYCADAKRDQKGCAATELVGIGDSLLHNLVYGHTEVDAYNEDSQGLELGRYRLGLLCLQYLEAFLNEVIADENENVALQDVITDY